jgi:hypothetical protein
MTRGHLPKSDFLNFSSCGSVSSGPVVALRGGEWYHFGQPSRCHDVARVHQAVQVAGRLLNLLAHLIVAVKVEDVGDKVEGVLVVLNLGVQPRQIEAIGKVLFVDLAEVLVPPRRYKLAAR